MVVIDSSFMIAWLQGQPMGCWTQGNRKGILLVCGHVGYEVQITSRHQNQLKGKEETAIWIHQIQRDDGSSLFGFPEQQERDLFRHLISVNGVGPQAGMALLQDGSVSELIDAICSGDLRRLSRAQGIGKRIAERLAVELRTKLADLDGRQAEPSLVDGGAASDSLQVSPELEETLAALGYEDLEIRRAIRAIRDSQQHPDSGDAEGWIRACLQWLSRESA